MKSKDEKDEKWCKRCLLITSKRSFEPKIDNVSYNLNFKAIKKNYFLLFRVLEDILIDPLWDVPGPANYNVESNEVRQSSKNFDFRAAAASAIASKKNPNFMFQVKKEKLPLFLLQT